LTNKLWEVAKEKSGEHLPFDPYQANEHIKWMVIQEPGEDFIGLLKLLHFRH